MKLKPLAAVVAAGALLATGCITAGDYEGGRPTPATTAPATRPVLDFSVRETVTLADGWVVGPCEGEAPLRCVDHDGTPAGQLELLSYPTGTLDGQGALEAVAAGVSTTMSEDRRLTCGPDYTFADDPPVPATVGGAPGLRFGWTLRRPGGGIDERHVSYATVTGPTLYLVTTSAFSPEPCVGDHGIRFSPEDLDRLLPLLDQLITDTRLPSP